MNVTKGRTYKGHRHLGMMAAMLGRRANVRVCFDTTGGAYTDGKEIHLPEFQVPLTDAEATLVEGLFDHELAHCRFTDFEHLASKTCTARMEKNGPLHFPLLNALEDVWIERKQAEIYPGCARAITAATEMALNRGNIIGQMQIQSNAEALIVMVACGLIGRQSRIERLVDIGNRGKAVLSAAIGVELTETIWTMAFAGVSKCISTRNADDLADSILTLLRSALPPESDAEAPQNPEAAMAKGEQDRGPEKGETMANEAQVAAIREMLEDRTATYVDIAERLCELLKASGATRTSPTSKAADWSGLEPMVEGKQRLLAEPRDFAATSRFIVAKLGVRLESLLEAKTEECTSISRSGREISPSRLVNLRFGETNVFRKFEDAEGIDTAVTVVIDLSGSMFADAHPEAIAKNAAFAVLQVLERFEVPTELYAFGTEPVRVKTFDQTWRRQREFLDVQNLGGTATEHAIFKAAIPLGARPEARKLLLLVTDGEPNDAGSAAAAIFELRSWGIEAANLFLGSEGAVFEGLLSGNGFHVERCLNMDDLPVAIFKAVQRSF